MDAERADASGSFPLVLLAGGASSRMGSPKGLLRVGEGESARPWLEEQLARFASASGARAVVVVGFDADLYAQSLDWYDAAARPGGTQVRGVRAFVTRNPDPALGPFSSLQHGLAAIADAPGAWVLPIDVPCATRATFLAVAERLRGEVDAVVPTVDGRGGHPVLLSRAFASRLRERSPDDPDARLDVQLRSLPSASLVRVAVSDPAVRANLNTPEDWANARVT